tara:strand:- start:643 stop:912 length:270 start_codon:yes stop_codon:yes gene_type:complete
MKLTKSALRQMIKEEIGATRFDPEPRRELQQGEIEIMKGRGDVQKWFYVYSAQDAMTLVKLGRNYGFPTGIIQNLSSEEVPRGYHIQEG